MEKREKSAAGLATIVLVRRWILWDCFKPYQLLKLLTVYLAVFLCAISTEASTRVALVSNYRNNGNDDVLALAEAKLSQLADIEMVERREVDRLLQEQQLAPISERALTIGRLLKVQVFVSVEMVPRSKEALGLVIYDAHTGARLWDAALPAGINAQVKSITECVQQANLKRQTPVAQLHPISLLTVRNADMPRSMDVFCEAVDRLLVRNLTDVPKLLLLERTRLEQINVERELTGPATNDLLGSLTLLQIDVSRITNGAGLQAVIQLSSPSEKDTQRLRVQTAGEDAVALADALAASIKTEFSVSPGSADALQRKNEARRFQHEAIVRRTHEEINAAWRAAEVAHALNPEDIPMESVLMCFLLEEGIRRPLPEALDFGTRSLSFRESHLLPALATANRQRMWEEERKELRAIEALVRFVAVVAKPARYSTDPEIRRKYAQFSTQLFHLDEERFEAWAGLAAARPQELRNFTNMIISRHAFAVCHLLSEDELIGRMDHVLRRWLEIANAAPVGSLEQGEIHDFIEQTKGIFNAFGQAIVGLKYDFKQEHFKKLIPLAETMAASPIPAISAEGKSYLQFMQASAATKVALNGGITPELLGKIREENLYRQSLEEKIKSNRKPAEKLTIYMDEMDAMLARKHIYSFVAGAACDFALRYRLTDPRLMDQLERLIFASETTNSQAFAGMIPSQNLTANLRYYRRQLQKQASVESSRNNPAPWESPRLLVNLSQFPEIDALIFATAAEDNVYALGMKAVSSQGTDNQIRLFLIQASMTDGKAKMVNQVSLTTSASQTSQPIPHIQLVASNLLMLVKEAPSQGASHRLYAMPLDGKPALRVDESWELPSREISCFTVVDGKIILGMNGYIVSCDFTSKKVDVLASSRRADKRSDLDNNELFRTPLMVQDAKRQRIVVVIERSGNTEFWSLDPHSGRLGLLTKHKCPYQAEDWCNQGEDDLFSSSSLHIDHFHLDSNKLDPISYGSLPGQEWVMGPHFVQQGYLWSAGAFGRVALADKKVEQFPLVSPPNPDATPPAHYPYVPNIPFCFRPVGNSGNILLGSAAGVWLLPLREVPATVKDSR